MYSIEQKALETYQNNMRYLSESHPNIHKKMQTLEAAIETGQFHEKYALEYLDGYFDVKEHNTGNYLCLACHMKAAIGHFALLIHNKSLASLIAIVLSNDRPCLYTSFQVIKDDVQKRRCFTKPLPLTSTPSLPI
jgi:hypothetical protein